MKQGKRKPASFPLPALSAWLLAGLFLCCAPSSGLQPIETKVDDEPPFQVLVRQLEGVERGYTFEIVNRTQGSLVQLVLGTGDEQEMLGVDFNYPLEIRQPECWTGIMVPAFEDIHIQIVWRPREPECAVGPESSLAGFGLTMPPIVERQPLYFSDGTLAEPLEITTAPFSARFKDMPAIKGRVEIAKSDQEPDVS